MQDISVKVARFSDRKYWLMYYVDPTTEKRISRSTKKTTRRDAERAALEWERDLREGRSTDARITWDEFCKRFERERLAGMPSQEHYIASLQRLTDLVGPKRLSGVTPAVISEFTAKLRETNVKPATIATRLAHLKVALRWAEDIGLIAKAPKVCLPKLHKTNGMRGRAITGEEFDRMLAAVPKVRKREPEKWQRFIRGLWLSGLRLNEGLELSWDQDAAFCIDLSGRRPRFRIYAEAQKARRDQLLPLTPDFAQFILETPERQRTGLVFDLRGDDRPMSVKRVSRTVTAFATRAGVVAERSAGTGQIRYVSAHDLRRSFGTRWARRVMPATLKLLMRHASIETTMRYYVDIQADDLADELWNQFGPPINTLINSPSETVDQAS